MVRRRAGLGLLAALLLGTACQGPGPAPAVASAARTALSASTFTEAVAGFAGFLNPLFADEDGAREIDGLVYQGLTRVGPDQQAEPLLAKSITVSTDRLTYSVTLRDGVFWADGEPLTITDVLFTFAALQDPAYTGPEAAAWKGISVRKTGAAGVDFGLKAPSAGFPLSLRIGILPQHLFPGVVTSFPANPHSGAQALGTGPFKVESISLEHSVVTLKRNPRAMPLAKLETVVFRGYRTLAEAAQAVRRGEADAVGGFGGPDLDRVLHQPGLAVNEFRTFSFAAVFLNLGGEFSGTPAVRRALSQSIDRAKLIKDVLGGRADPQAGPLPPSSWAYSAAAGQRYAYDPVAAVQAFEDAGWRLPAQGLYRTRTGHDFEVGLVAADAFPYKPVAAALQVQLLAVGVRVKVSLVPVAELVSRYLVGRTYDMAVAGYDNGPDPDQYVLWHSTQKAYPLNFSNLPKQAFIDKDLEDGRAGSDRAQRQPAYNDFQTLLVDAMPALFLYEPHYIYVVSKRIRGVHANPALEAADRFEYLADWSAA